MIGKLTNNQVICLLVVLLVVILILKMIKGIIKWILFAVVLCCGLVYFGLATPKQIQDVSKQIANQGIQTYQKIADTSENIRIKDNKIQVKVDTGKWLNLDKLNSIIKSTDKEIIVIFDGKQYKITDKKVKELIESFR